MTSPRPSAVSRVFLLSPAFCGGERARMLMREGAGFSLALRLRSAEGITLREAFTFASGLYFRGKAAYAARFSRAPKGTAGGLVIVPGEGLVDMEQYIRLEDLRRFATVPVELSDPRFREPLIRDAKALRRRLGTRGEAVLLGSVASGKYREPLLEVLGQQLLFPTDFVGRGDMSRGGLMLRCVESEEELAYQAVEGAILRGGRVPRLPPKPRRRAEESGTHPLNQPARA